jgi:hypothetical protein
MLRRVKARPDHGEPWKWDRTVVGVITNSDDRVVGVLRSLGLKLAPRRVDVHGEREAKASAKHDVDFVVMSYDAGFEKPSPQIFEAAKTLLGETLVDTSDRRSADDFHMLYVGDEIRKDYFGAKAAGWNALFLDRKRQFTNYLPESTSIADVELVQEGRHDGVEAIRDLAALTKWSPS